MAFKQSVYSPVSTSGFPLDINHFHPEFEIASTIMTASEVGGDYYDFHLEEDGPLIVVIADATGHCGKAGLMVTAAKFLFTLYGSRKKTCRKLSEVFQDSQNRPESGSYIFRWHLHELKRGNWNFKVRECPKPCFSRPKAKRLRKFQRLTCGSRSFRIFI